MTDATNQPPRCQVVVQPLANCCQNAQKFFGNVASHSYVNFGLLRQQDTRERASLIVWDQKTDPPDGSGEILCWQSYAQGGQLISVPRHLEDHAERIRAKYLAFVHDLGEHRVKGRRLLDHLDFGGGFSFWWMTRISEKSPYKSPALYGCLRLLALEEIFLERRPSHVHLVSVDRDLARAIRELCRNLAIDFSFERKPQSPQPWTLRRCHSGLPYLVQGLAILAKRLVTRWRLRGAQAPQWFAGNDAIFLCSYFIHLDPASCAEGRFYSRQWGALPRYLHDQGRRTNWIQHFLFSAEVPDARTGVDWFSRFNADADRQGHHAFLDSYLSWRVVARAVRCWLWLNAVSWRLRHIDSAFCPAGSAVWLWPVLKRDWQSSLRGPTAMNNCLCVALFDAALSHMPHQAVGFYLWEGQDWECALLRAWRRHGHGELIGVSHTTIPFWHLTYFYDPRSVDADRSCAPPLPDLMAVNGPAAWRALVGVGYPAERLVEVEALRYLNLSRTIGRSLQDLRNHHPAKQPICASRVFDVLVLGDSNPESMRNLLGLLDKTLQMSHSDCRLTFKPHPAYAVDLANYAYLKATQTTEALDRILGDYDLVVAANGTSGAVDAYHVGLPVIIALNGDDLNLNPLRNQAGVYFVSTPEEFADAVQAAGKGPITDRDLDEFFFLDPELPRWLRLLSVPSHMVRRRPIQSASSHVVRSISVTH